MKVLMKVDVDRVGKAGEVLNVSDGYARNYLLPKKLAVKVDKTVQSQLDSLKESKEWHKEQDIEKAKELQEKLKGQTVEVEIKMNSKTNKLFSRVTTADVADALSKKIGQPVKKNLINIDNVQNAAGVYKATARLYSFVETTFNVEVKVVEA